MSTVQASMPVDIHTEAPVEVNSRRGDQRTDTVLLVVAVLVCMLAVAATVVIAVLNNYLRSHLPSAVESPLADSSDIGFALGLLALAMIVVVRQRRHPIGWLLMLLVVVDAVDGVTYAIGQIGLAVPGSHISSAGGWAAVSESSTRLEYGVPFAILLLFPTGRVPSRRWRSLLWAVGVLFPLWFLSHLFRPATLEESPFTGVHNPWTVSWLGGPLIHYGFLPTGGLVGLLVLASVVVRFRHSRGDERQQLKWVGLVVSGVPLGIVGLGIGSLIGPSAMNVAGNVAWACLAIGMPVAVVVAITRYRLYDLDLLVNRGAVYLLLCMVLVVTYAMVVLVATRVVVDTAGWNSPVVVAIAAVVAAVVAAPARQAIQHSIDRVFQPRTWNARRRLEAFAQRSREVAQPPAALQQVLVTSLGDSSAELGLWMRDRLAYVGVDGRPLGALEVGRSSLRLDLHREPVAVLRHDAAFDRDHRLLETVATGAALVAENARLQAEVLAQLSEVHASRSRIIAAADAERRRVERDLHDGAQQRLVGLAVRVKLASRTSDDPLLTQIVAELQAATRELRELARGIHPAALEQGLGAALEALAARTPVPLDVEIVAADRLPGEVERTVYYLACEAITNAVKHADASRIEVFAQVVGDRLVLTVHDNGRGGADASRGSGIAGLYDRAAAIGGSVRLDSPAGFGTTIVVDVPCGC